MGDSYDNGDYTFSNQSGEVDHAAPTTSCTSYNYNPVNYDTVDYRDWNQYTLQSTINECRTDLKPTVLYDHFFRAAIASDVKNKETKNDDAFLSKYANNILNTKRTLKLPKNDMQSNYGIKFGRRPSERLTELCEEIDNVVLPTSESDDKISEKSDEQKDSSDSKNERNQSVKDPEQNDNNKTNDENNNKKEKVVNKRFVVSFNVPETIVSTADGSDGSNEMIEMGNKNEDIKDETDKYLSVDMADRRQSCDISNRPNAVRKKFSIVSLFNDPSGTLNSSAGIKKIFTSSGAVNASTEHLNNLSEIMSKCLTQQNLSVEEKKAKAKGTEKPAKNGKTVHFNIQDTEDEKTILEINRKLIEEGLPDLEDCMISQKEVSRKKKKRQHTKDKISGLIFSFLIFSVVISLGSLLTFRIMKQVSTEKKLNQQLLNESAIVSTSCYEFIGKKTEDHYSFIGVPYVHELEPKRWKNYSMASCKTHTFTVINATNYGSVCTQMYNGKVIGSEKCQYLNIWTPQINTPHKLPVIFYIHGGDFTKGSGNLKGDFNMPSSIFENTVLVTFNYRLNIFGFFVYKNETNYGFSDQILALKWVNDNIHHFGGDRNKIILMGEEAGAVSAFALSISKKGMKRFQNVWISNMPVNLLEVKKSNINEMKQKYKEYIHKKFNCTIDECLLLIKSSELCKAYEEFRLKENFDLLSTFIYDDNKFFTKRTEVFLDEVKDMENNTFLNFKPKVNNLASRKIVMVIGTNYNYSIFNKNQTIICNTYKLLRLINSYVTPTLYHYNVAIDDLSDSISDKSINDASYKSNDHDRIEITSIFNFKHNLVTQNTLNNYLIEIANNDPTIKFTWKYFPTETLMLKSTSVRSNNHFESYCKSK